MKFLKTQVRPSRADEKVTRKIDMTDYIDGQKINYGKLIADEVLAVDSLIVDAAKKNMDVAGTNLKATNTITLESCAIAVFEGKNGKTDCTFFG